jgi:hypothetical protein
MRLGSVILASTLLAACGHGLPSKPGVPSGIPDKPGIPGGASGEVDPNTCGNYAAQDAGMKLKAFLQATKDLETATTETVKVIKQSCIMMGQELQMSDADLAGDDTNGICAKVITQYQNNLKVELKPSAKLKIAFKPGVCTVEANASASAGAGCSGGASAGTGGSGGGGQCAAAAKVQGSLKAECTPPALSIDFDAKVVLDKTKLEMTVKAMRDGLPKLFSVTARLKLIQDAVAVWVKSIADLKDMGPKFVQSFGDQAMCISGQIAAAANASTHIQANVSVSVNVSASASGSVGGGG